MCFLVAMVHGESCYCFILSCFDDYRGERRGRFVVVVVVRGKEIEVRQTYTICMGLKVYNHDETNLIDTVKEKKKKG